MVDLYLEIVKNMVAAIVEPKSGSEDLESEASAATLEQVSLAYTSYQYVSKYQLATMAIHYIQPSSSSLNFGSALLTTH